MPGGRNNIPPLRQAPLVMCHCVRPLIFIMPLFCLSGCLDNSIGSTESELVNNKDWKIILKHTNIDLTIKLPTDYDTMFAWKETSCQCFSNKYRIQSKKVPIYLDGCCMDNDIPYNKLQMTIQEPLYSFDSTIIVKNETIIKNHQQDILYSQNDPQTSQTIYDTILSHQSKVFSIFANIIHDIKHSVFRQSLSTTIYLRGLPISITFERSYSKLPLNRKIFINECISFIKSISTSNGT